MIHILSAAPWLNDDRYRLILNASPGGQSCGGGFMSMTTPFPGNSGPGRKISLYRSGGPARNRELYPAGYLPVPCPAGKRFSPAPALLHPAFWMGFPSPLPGWPTGASGMRNWKP